MKIKGITLISLIITITVIVILAGTGIFISLNLIGKIKENSFITKMSKIEEIIELRLLEEEKTEEQGKPVENEIMAESAKVLVAEFNALQLETKQAIIKGRNQVFDSAKENYTEEEIINLFKIGEDITKDAGYASIYDSNVGAVYKIEPIVINGKAKVTTGNIGILRNEKVLSTQNITNQKGNIAKISAGVYHSLAIDKDGYLWAWGENDYGKLGNGTTINSAIPIKIKEDTKFKEIAGGTNHSLAIDEDGYLWAWGYNYNGQLGNGTTIDSTIPIKIKEEMKFKAIATGGETNLAIDKDGQLWAWGYNFFGQIGNGKPKSELQELTLVPIKEETKFKEVSVGHTHSLAIDEDGYLWAWGHNYSEQLGKVNIVQQNYPVKIKEDIKFKKISAGDEYSLAIDEDGYLWAWGNNEYGRLGNGTTINSAIPIKIQEDTKFKEISAGNIISLVIDEQGYLWGCGYNINGHLGEINYKSSEYITSLTKIIPNTLFNLIDSESYITIAIDVNGEINICGNNFTSEFKNKMHILKFE